VDYFSEKNRGKTKTWSPVALKRFKKEEVGMTEEGRINAEDEVTVARRSIHPRTEQVHRTPISPYSYGYREGVRYLSLSSLLIKLGFLTTLKCGMKFKRTIS
jgi:hypothetical protein